MLQKNFLDSNQSRSPENEMQKLKPWKDAATVMLAARFPKSVPGGTNSRPSPAQAAAPTPEPGNQPSPISYTASPNFDLKTVPPSQAYDYKLLMLKRSAKSKFMGNAFVFPGGKVDNSDFTTEWTSVFHNILGTRNLLKGNRLDWGEFYPRTTNRCRPPMLEHPQVDLPPNRSLPPDVGFRICAVRETFEESGVLLCVGGDDIDRIYNVNKIQKMSKTIDSRILSEWRKKVHENADSFIEMCKELSVLPNIWSLWEWTDWLTPTTAGKTYGGRRFDTIFYLSCLPSVPDHVHDSTEITGSHWCTPRQCLEDFTNKKMSLAPPQLYEISSLASITSYHELHKLARASNQNGCERWLPVRINCADGVLSVLPGDDLYPAEPDLLGEHDDLSRPETMEQLNTITSAHHRFEITIKDGIQLHLRCNLASKFGRLSPKL